MNGVDLADQLRNYYTPDHWMRKRKWWWSIFIWCVGVVQTNAYLLYKSVHVKAGNEKKMLSHYDFVKTLALQLIWPELYDSRHKQVALRTRVVQYERSGHAKKSTSKTGKKKRKAVTVLTTRTIQTKFPRRHDGNGHALAPTPGGSQKYCQFCRYRWTVAQGKKKKKKKEDESQDAAPKTHGSLTCQVCNLRLCYHCWHDWHGIGRGVSD